MPVAAPVSREAQLLLSCARTELVPLVADGIKSLAQEAVDWASLVEMAWSNGVTPLLYRSVMATCADAVPAATLRHLADLCRINAMRSLAMTAELLRLLELLDAHGIRALPFKGPVLAAAAYGDVTLREFYDLDILVGKRDLQRARELLMSQGYLTREQARGAQDCSPTRKHSYLEHANCGTGFDLHWRFTPRYFASPVDGDQILSRLVPVSLLGSTVPSLSPEDALLVLCAHGATGCWRRLLLVCDVAQLVSANPRMNWTTALVQAAKTGSLRRLLLGLVLARNLLGTELPREVSEALLADAKVVRLAAEASHRMLSAQPGALGHVESGFIHLATMERVRDKLLYCLGLLHESVTPNSTDRSVVPLPEFMHVLYYLIHPIRLAVTYGPSALRHLLKRAS